MSLKKVGCLMVKKNNNIGWLFILEMSYGDFSKLKNVVLKTKVQVLIFIGSFNILCYILKKFF